MDVKPSVSHDPLSDEAFAKRLRDLAERIIKADEEVDPTYSWDEAVEQARAALEGERMSARPCLFCNKLVGHWSDCPSIHPGFDTSRKEVAKLKDENKRLREFLSAICDDSSDEPIGPLILKARAAQEG